MNKIEELKAERDGLDVGKKIETFAQQGWETILEGDIERLKWHGIFFRKHTPGFFMMRIRIPNGIASVDQARTLAQISRQFGRGSWISRHASNSNSAGSGSNRSRRSCAACRKRVSPASKRVWIPSVTSSVVPSPVSDETNCSTQRPSSISSRRSSSVTGRHQPSQEIQRRHYRLYAELYTR